VAIKYIKGLDDCEYDWIKVIREIQIMHEFTKMKNNTFVVKLLDLKVIQETRGTHGVFIVMEHMESDLKKLLNQCSHVELNPDHILQLM
jgi:hypothetical protein